MLFTGGAALGLVLMVGSAGSAEGGTNMSSQYEGQVVGVP